MGEENKASGAVKRSSFLLNNKIWKVDKNCLESGLKKFENDIK